MNGSLIVGLVILAWLVIGCVLMVVDVTEECRRHTELAEHEEQLDALWFDGDPSAVTLEAVSATGRAE